VILTVEVSPEQYERIAAGDLSALAARVAHIEIRQRDGVLATRRRVGAIVPMSGVVAVQHGVANGDGPPISVVFGAEEEPQ
jgi:hypothetical protein